MPWRPIYIVMNGSTSFLFVTYRDNIPLDKKPDDLYIGLIAEEVNKAYPAATEYTEDGQVEMWNIKVLFPALLKIVQDQQKEIEALKEQINNKLI